MIPFGVRLRVLIEGFFFGLAGLFGVFVILSLSRPVKEINSKAEGMIYDFMFRAKPKLEPPKKLIIIDVEDLNQSLTRGDYARLIDNVAQAGAKAIGVDLLFDRPKDESDALLVQTVNQHAEKLVLAYRFVHNLISPNEAALHQYNLADILPAVPSFWRGMPQRTGVELPFDPLLTPASRFGMGHATYNVDYDNVIRRFPAVTAFGNGFYPCLALEIARRYLDATYALEAADSMLVLQKNGAEPLPIPFDADGDLLINFIPATEFSAKYTLATLPDPLGTNFQNAVVLIVNSLGENTVATPFLDPYPAWALHASFFSQILERSFIRDDIGDTMIWSEAFVLLAILGLVGVEYRRDPTKRKTWVMLLVLNALFLAFAFIKLCFDAHLFVVAPALVMTLSYVIAKKRLRHLIRPPVYEPFGLAVLERQGQNYPLQVFESPFGAEEANATFEYFLDDETLKETLQRLKDLSANRDDLIWMGNKLFKAIFPGAIDSVLTRSLDAVTSKGTKLRLKLRIDPPELHGLPWELIRSDRLRRGFLAVNKSLPLSLTRYLALEQPITKPRFRSPLRILVLIAKPADLQPLPGALTEKKYIKKSLFWLRLVRDVKLTIRENVTRDILANELERDPPDILHYIGHSGFDPARNKAFLALETAPDQGIGSARHLVPPPEPAPPVGSRYEEFEAEELGNLMLSDSPVKLVILNSCEGAAAAQTDAFVGIAQNLVSVGVPAVVAMQYPIFDQSALLFSKFFYSSFLKNYSIDEAVAGARKYISSRIGLSKQDWATPVLFMRTYNENIFKIE